MRIEPIRLLRPDHSREDTKEVMARVKAATIAPLEIEKTSADEKMPCGCSVEGLTSRGAEATKLLTSIAIETIEMPWLASTALKPAISVEKLFGFGTFAVPFEPGR